MPEPMTLEQAVAIYDAHAGSDQPDFDEAVDVMIQYARDAVLVTRAPLAAPVGEDVHVLVSPEILARRDEWFKTPVTVEIRDGERGRVEMTFHRHDCPAPSVAGPAAGTEEMVECDTCDGCGWYEGGQALKTHCIRCNGTGALAASARGAAS